MKMVFKRCARCRPVREGEGQTKSNEEKHACVCQREGKSREKRGREGAGEVGAKAGGEGGGGEKEREIERATKLNRLKNKQKNVLNAARDNGRMCTCHTCIYSALIYPHLIS